MISVNNINGVLEDLQAIVLIKKNKFTKILFATILSNKIIFDILVLHKFNGNILRILTKRSILL